MMVTLFCAVAGAQLGSAQQPPNSSVPPARAPANPEANAATPDQVYGQLLQVPVNTFVPGAAVLHPAIAIPAMNDPAAPQRGMRAFTAFNCVGCHMGNGGGGMGPSLSDGNFIYGGEPQNIQLAINLSSF